MRTLFRLCFLLAAVFLVLIREGAWGLENGDLATFSATKHQVSVRRKHDDFVLFGSGHRCGGSLIAENVVLTAASCFYDFARDKYGPYTDYVVVMGTLNRVKRHGALIYAVQEIVYKHFNPTTMENDIAILILDESVPSDHRRVRPIVLNHEATIDGTPCQRTGWSGTASGEISHDLLTVDVSIISKEKCKIKGKLLKGIICGKNGDVCGGDTGGPLVCKHLLTGFSSLGVKCLAPVTPKAYIEVSFYAKWIKEQLSRRGIKLHSSASPGVMFSLEIISFVSLINSY